jgi:hypothetical protein
MKRQIVFHVEQMHHFAALRILPAFVYIQT